MTALIFRGDPNDPTVVVDEDDGCQPGNHRRDELCARTRVETLPPADDEHREFADLRHRDTVAAEAVERD